MRTASILFGFFLAVAPASAQILTIGNDEGHNGSDAGIAAIRTDVDLNNPAAATGTISTVKFYWTRSECRDAVKIKFFHRIGNVMKLTAERGPFDISAFDTTLTLSSPVLVSQGDLIGITNLTDCGNATVLGGVAAEGYLIFPFDVVGAVDIGSATPLGGKLHLFGSGSATESIKGVITNVGATAGSFGSHFKTALQLFNPESSQVRGRIDFRPAGSAYNVTNSILYTIDPGKVIAYPDVVGENLGQTGLGTIDLVVPAGTGTPIGIVRVYNDAGLDGTSAFTEPVIDPDMTMKGVTHILKRGMTGYLVTPMNPAATRFNIGLRTLTLGATVDIRLKNTDGSELRHLIKEFPPFWFEQNSAAVFLGVDVQGNQTIEFDVTAGSVIVYGTTTDNTTNDPNIQFATIIFSAGG